MVQRAAGSRLAVQPVVFWGSSALIALILLYAVVDLRSVAATVGALQQAIVQRMGWFYVLSVTGFLLFAVWLLISRFGSIRLGPDDAEPEFSRPTWFAMLFSAGMGIGLFFFGVAEPVMHFEHPPLGDPRTAAAARQAMALTFFHWGLHPWGVYSIIGLALAYFGFRRNLPLSLRSALAPLLGARTHGAAGHLVDILAVVSTLFGVATSLGFGASQVNAGLAYVLGLEQTPTMQVVIIAVITAMATASVVSGLKVGIRRLSELNMSLAALLLLFLFVTGPSASLLRAFVDNVGAYLELLPHHSLWTGAYAGEKARKWLGSWTILYWSWWIAWAPFVGIFIARISRGRTIREFLLAVLLGPTATGFVWFTIFGNSALHQELYGAGGIGRAVSASLPTAVFVLLERYPLAGVTGVICVVCVVLFFVTSSDSASLVVDTIASGGQEHPPVAQRVYWAVLEGAVAAVLMFAGGLSALQTAALTSALPFCVVIIGVCVSLWRALHEER